MQHILSICILAYYIAKYLDRLFGEKEDVPLEKWGIIKKKIQYVVNDKNIDHSHTIYYLQVLDIYGKKSINNDTICSASYHKLEEMIKHYNKIVNVDSEDIKAARSYLFEQWSYCVNLN